LQDIAETAMSFKIVGLGEVLWDMLPAGQQLGGAPANFTCHARALGADATLISRVGHDDLGREIIARLDALGVNTGSIAMDARHPTGTVSIELDAGQPRYVIHENVAWDFIEATPDALADVRSADAVCFGTLAQRAETSRLAIRSLVSASAPDTLRVCDINLRQHFYSQELIAESLVLANVLKLNDAELPVLAALFGLMGDTRAQVAALAARFSLRLVVLTRGAQGSLLFDGTNCSEHPGIDVPVKDTIGAGDSFTAATVLGFLAGWELGRINAFANEVAAFVCSHHGATPPLPEDMRAAFGQKVSSPRAIH
jgi:fructokinase